MKQILTERKLQRLLCTVCMLLLFPLGNECRADLSDHYNLYATSVLLGKESPADIMATWSAKRVSFRIHYAGTSPLEQEFPQLQTALIWFAVSFEDKSIVDLQLDPVAPPLPEADLESTPGIDLYIYQSQREQGSLKAIRSHFPDSTVFSDTGIDGCTLARFSRGSSIQKAIGVLNIGLSKISNVKCVSMTLLFGLGLNVVPEDLEPMSWYGVMTRYQDENHILPDPEMDMNLLKLLYGSQRDANKTRQDALEEVRKMKAAQ